MSEQRVIVGDCIEVMRGMPDCSVDAVVTDPPAGISFMCESWDSDKGGRDRWIAWLTEVMREALRVLKPGGHALVWALPRTSHWTGMALENSGFEVRDRVTHLFGSGFPKSLSVPKAIDKHLGEKPRVVGSRKLGGNAAVSCKDKGGSYGVGVGTAPPIAVAVTAPSSAEAQQWSGWGTALKPAAEDWWLCRKPLAEKTIAANVLAHGTGAINIDACRIATDWNEPDRPESWKRSGNTAQPDTEKIAAPPGEGITCHPGGRWPANVVLDEVAAAELDEQSGERPGFAGGTLNRGATTGRGMGYASSSSSSSSSVVLPGFRDTGGASRFYYCAKASTRERERGCAELPRDERSGRANKHSTVKPLSLMSWLARLITPPGGTILDPFCGSGTTGIAAKLEGFSFIGIEQDEDYAAIAQARIVAWEPEAQASLFPGDAA